MNQKKIWITSLVVLFVVVFLLAILVGSRFRPSEGKGEGLWSSAYSKSADSEMGTEALTESFAGGTEIIMDEQESSQTEEEEEAGGNTAQGEAGSSGSANGGSSGGTASNNSSGSGTSKNRSESTASNGNSGSAASNSSKSSSSGTAKVAEGLASPSKNGALQVKGNQLVDSNGNAVQLRGISTHGLAWYPDYVNRSCFAELHSWGANVIRLAMYTAEYGGYCSGGSKSELKALVKKGVSYATAEDMYVIIDWHILSDGNPNTYKSEAKSFFKEMSAEFAGNNNVIYEICNEPNGGTSWSDIKSYAKEIIPVIRANDKDAIIIVGTPTWSQDVDKAAADPISGYSNLMYALHFYAGTHKADLRNKMTAAADAGLPIFVSEYGICDASGSGSIDTDSANQWISTMDSYGISYVAWNLSNKSETSAIISSSVSKTSGFSRSDLSTSGKWVYDMLVKAAGSSGSSGSGGSGTSGSSNSGSSGSGSSGSSGSGSSGTSGSSNSGSSGSSNSGSSGSGSSGTSGSSNSGSSGSGSSGTSGSSNSGSSGSGSGTSGSSSKVTLTNSDLNITPTLVNSWESNGTYFYQYSVQIKNKSSKAGTAWNIQVNFNESFVLSDGWNGTYSISGKTLSIKSMDYNGALAAGAQTGDIGFIISGSSKLKIL